MFKCASVKISPEAVHRWERGSELTFSISTQMPCLEPLMFLNLLISCNKSLASGNRMYLLLYQHCVHSLPVTWDTSLFCWGLSPKINVSKFFIHKEVGSSKSIFVTEHLFTGTKSSLVVSLLFSIDILATLICCDFPWCNPQDQILINLLSLPFCFGIQPLQGKEVLYSRIGVLCPSLWEQVQGC